MNRADIIEAAAEAFLAAVLPAVLADDLAQLPPRSVLIRPHAGGVWVFRWDGSSLVDLDDPGSQRDPAWLIDRYGPLTLVWRPEGSDQ